MFSSREKVAGSVGSTVVRAAADVCVPPMTEMCIYVRSDRKGLSAVRPVQRKRQQVFLANGLIDIENGDRWIAWVANISEVPVTLNRGQVVGMAEEPPTVCAMIPEAPETETGSSEVVDPLTDIVLDVNSDEKEQVIKMLRKHSKLWDG
jgi:hypothetical protein